jgi:hypothetical protein
LMLQVPCCCYDELPITSHDFGWLLLVCCPWGVGMRDMLFAMAVWSILLEKWLIGCWTLMFE